eukprot:3009684-Pleurochrysis_carterae.AAC.6
MEYEVRKAWRGALAGPIVWRRAVRPPRLASKLHGPCFARAMAYAARALRVFECGQATAAKSDISVSRRGAAMASAAVAPR